MRCWREVGSNGRVKLKLNVDTSHCSYMLRSKALALDAMVRPLLDRVTLGLHNAEVERSKRKDTISGYWGKLWGSFAALFSRQVH